MAASPLLILAAILLPPLAVFLREGAGRDFLIGLGLTCLGYLPGIGWALYILFGRSPARQPA